MNSSVDCSCGFSASSDNEDTDIEELFRNHPCPNKPKETWIVGVTRSIFENVFSLSGILIAFIIYMIVSHVYNK